MSQHPARVREGLAPPHPRLSGRLRVGAIVFMVIVAAAPLTVIGGNVPLAIGVGNGVGAPVGFAIAATVLLIFSIGFVTMTPHVTEAGAFFSYVTAGLGSRLGLGAAFVALVAYTAIQVGVYGYMGWAANDLVRYFGGPELPWWLYSFGTVAVVALLGFRHIELSAKVLGVALVLEISIVLILDAVIFATGGDSGLVGQTFAPENVLTGSIGVAVLFALTGFIGFEATAVFRDEARDPERTIPRATYLSVIIIGAPSMSLKRSR
jgi:amino acid transporter